MVNPLSSPVLSQIQNKIENVSFARKSKAYVPNRVNR